MEDESAPKEHTENLQDQVQGQKTLKENHCWDREEAKPTEKSIKWELGEGSATKAEGKESQGVSVQ